MARRYGLILVCTTVAALLTSLAAAAGVTWQASAGYEKTTKDGRWIPVFVDIENTGPSRTGLVRISVGANPQSTGGTTFTRNVELPQNSRKRYTLYAPEVPADGVFLNVGWGWDKKEVASGTRAGATDRLVVVVGGDQGFLGFLRGESAAPVSVPDERGGGGNPTSAGTFLVAHVGWDQLPDRWLGFDCADVVVLGDAESALATPDGIKALTDWVRLGGTLVVPGGTLAPTLGSSPLRDLLPVTVAGAGATGDLRPLTAWVGEALSEPAALVASMRPREGATVLCGNAQAPLVVSGAAGSGRVVMSSFDYRAAPIKHWDGQSSLWRALADPQARRASLLDAAFAADWNTYGGAWSLSQVAKYAPQARLPSLWLVGLFLVAYIVVLVPVNYFFLKRRDRLELAWLTSPAIVCAFTLGAYFIGYAVRGGQLIVNRVSVLEAGAGDTLAEGGGFIGIFSPTRARYSVTLPPSAVAAQPAVAGDEWAHRLPTIHYDSPMRVTDIAMSMWTSSALRTRFSTDLGKGIGGYADYDGQTYTAHITNGAPFGLSKARLVVDGKPGAATSIPRGGTVTLRVTQTELSTMPAYPFGGQAPSGPQAKDMRLDEMALYAIFGEAAGAYPGGYPGAPPSGMPPAGLMRGIWLCAFADPPVDVGALSRKASKSEQTTVVLIWLPLRMASKTSALIPPSAISVRLLPVADGVTPQTGPPGMGMTPSMGATRRVLVWEYTLPVERAKTRVTGMALAVTDGGFGGAPPGMGGSPGAAPATATASAQATPGRRCALLDVTTERWVSFDKLSSIEISQPERYVDGAGKVLLRETINSGYTSGTAPDLLVEVAQTEKSG